MIRINLLPRKKKGRSSAPVEGEKSVGIGFGILLAAGLMVFFFVHIPMQDDIKTQETANNKLKSDNQKIEQDTKNFTELKAAFESALNQALAIDALNAARSTPANFLFELATMLKPGGKPTTTKNMTQQIADNPNLRSQDDWDPKHVWINSITEKSGAFTLLGSAQSDGDVTQLVHRLNASMYFDNVQPEGAVKQTSGQVGGLTIYSFRITGTVRY